jgi:hypothetical protein
MRVSHIVLIEDNPADVLLVKMALDNILEFDVSAFLAQKGGVLLGRRRGVDRWLTVHSTIGGDHSPLPSSVHIGHRRCFSGKMISYA